MKSQRRHDLESNELAKRLSAAGDRVQPYYKALAVSAIVIVAALVVWMITSRIRAANRAEAWDAYTYAMISTNTDWDALHEAAKEHAGSPMGELASVTWADAQLRLATEKYFSDEDASQTHLKDAQEEYRRLIDEADDPSVVNRARLGMARALETDGKAQQAREYYDAVEGPFANVAQERSKQISTSAAQEAMNWLATAEPPQIQAPVGPGTPGLRPPFGSEFNLDPDIPSRFPTGLTDPATSGATGAANPNASGPLMIENPFNTPSDPDRYATPDQQGAAADAPDSDTATDNPSAPSTTEPTSDQSADDKPTDDAPAADPTSEQPSPEEGE